MDYGSQVATKDECATACNARSGCGSFEWSADRYANNENCCNLNTQSDVEYGAYLDFVFCSKIVPSPPPSSPGATVDTVETNSPGVWTDAGGECTCPSGSVYTVGWDWNTKELACIGGVPGECNGYRSDGNGCNDLATNGVKVTCGAASPPPTARWGG